MQSAFVVHAEPNVTAALASGLAPLPLLDPEMPPLELLDVPPELLLLTLDPPEELLEAAPEEPPVAPLLLELLALGEPELPVDEELPLDPDEPLPPELEPGEMPGDV